MLLRIHLDLFKIDELVTYDFGGSLTDFEVLVLALEDKRFFQHRGIDVVSVVREFWRAITFRRFGGASTIDMQFVRTATGYRERTLRRKLYEMLLAGLIQYRYTKFQILRAYLSHAFFGSRLIGAERASTRLYRIGPSALTLEQAAELAAMLVYPRPLVPTTGWRSRLDRRAAYAQRLYPRLKQRLKQLPIPELVEV